MQINISTIKTSSDGAWQGDNPLHFAFPLLIVQTTLVLIISRSLAFLLKPLRQPKVIAEILGGILLGPSAFGRNKQFMQLLFPLWSTPILESVASIGLLFFLFLVGLELDLSSIRRSGKKAFSIAIAGISLPFLLGVGLTFLLRRAIHGEEKVGFSQYLMFIGVSLSITAFPVLARILAELRLLTTQVGETAMAAAAFNDVIAWIFLALAIALAGNGAGGAHKSPINSLYILISGIAFVALMILVVRPVMAVVARRCSSQEYEFSDEAYICLTLGGVMLSGLTTDLIGIHAIFGAFIFGLIIPKEGEFAGRLIRRIEDFVTGLLLPLYFASSGLKTDVAKIRGAEAWGLLGVVISTSCAGKVLGTFLVAKLFMIPVRESLTLGVLMNTKGLVELIVLNIGKEKKVLNDETFAILVLMAIFTTFMTTPTVMAIYRPPRAASIRTHRKLDVFTAAGDNNDKLKVLACVHEPENVSSLINLIESIRSTRKSLLKLYVMHLLKLDERTSSIMMVKRFRKNGLPFINRLRRGEVYNRVAMAFQTYSQLGRVLVGHATAISALSSMHEDICHVAEDRRVTMIILPFHKQWIGEGDESIMENRGEGWRAVNQRVLTHAPCSVGVFIDRGFNGARMTEQTLRLTAPIAQRVCILFFGGPDDREALELGSRMANHPAVKVIVLRFVHKPHLDNSKDTLRTSGCSSNENSCTLSATPTNHGLERDQDDAAMTEHRSKFNGVAEYTEKPASNIAEEVLAIGQQGHYDLIIVGKGQFPPIFVAKLGDCQPVQPELGSVGDILASPSHGIVSSVLVIQQHNSDKPEKRHDNPVLQTQNQAEVDAHVVTVHDASSGI